MFAYDMTINVGTDTFDTVGCDLLNRAPFGKRLSELMERDTQPLVVALDGSWGAGKSHFLKLWTGTHNQPADHKARVIYIDAFAQDYLDDPLISLVAAISTAHNTEQGKSEKALAMVKACGLKLVRPAARAGLFVASAGISELALPVLDRLADKFIEEASDEAKAAIDNLWKHEESRIAAVKGFRDALTDLATEKPLILVIDELDRCRPDYALSLLEVVKHFFAVPGVRFVLGVNLETLEHSVRQRYGAGVDAGLYLQKFMHLRVGLPGQASHAAAPHWRDYFQKIRARISIDNEYFLDACDLLDGVNETRSVTLRDVERIAARLVLLPNNLSAKTPHIRLIVVSAVILEALDAGLYRKMRQGLSTKTEIAEFFALSKETLPTKPPHLAGFRASSLATWDNYLNLTDGSKFGVSGQGDMTESRMATSFYRDQVRDLLDSFAPPPAR